MRNISEPHAYEARVRCGIEAEQFAKAILHYIERHMDSDHPVMVHSIPDGEFDHKVVHLRSAAAVAEFASLWRRKRIEPPST